MGDALRFDSENYEVKTIELDGSRVTYRAFEGICYCEKPVSEVQKLNLFVPEVFYHGEQVNGYCLNNAPIFIPNTVGGYMEGPADGPGRDFMGKVNTIFLALRHGYVVVSPGVRGRSTGLPVQEFFVGAKAGAEAAATGKLVGRAPALIVDMKAVVRYLRHNRDVIPGDVEKIITNGTSAGGALSALAGATGNAAGYDPYLREIGAADERDDVFAASCYCPIHNLEHADAAYEWLFSGETTYHRMRFEDHGGTVEMIPETGEMTKEQTRLSLELKKRFPAYVNSLGLLDEQGNPLSLDENGAGSFLEYVRAYVKESAQRELDTHFYADIQELAVPGSRVEEQDCLAIEGGRVTDVDWDAYVRTITRMKTTPAFDALDLGSPENEEFGTEHVFAKHFTEFSAEHSLAGGAMADAEVIRLLNPLNFVGEADTARHWRIRHGAFDRDTSLAIPVILATVLKNRGYDVDFCLPWGVPHAGDYDWEELAAWIDSLND